MRDGFTRVELAEVAQWMACRFDSSEARGFSTAIAFTKRGFEPPPDELAEEAEETLEAAWERMQRSGARGDRTEAGRADADGRYSLAGKADVLTREHTACKESFCSRGTLCESVCMARGRLTARPSRDES